MIRLLVCVGFVLLFGLLYPRGEVEQPSSTPPSPPGPTQSPPFSDPVQFLEESIRRYDREVQGYRCILEKQERVQGKLRPVEVVQADFREKPFSVVMRWQQGAGLAAAVLYNESWKKKWMKALSFGFIWEKPVDAKEAKDSTRYTVDEFGIRKGTERTLARWKEMKEKNQLHVRYLGVKTLPQLGNRPCYVFHRHGIEKPEDDGIEDVTIYLDQENWLQIGSILLGKTINGEREIIGKYFFRDLRLNPDFPPDAFVPAALRKKV